MKIAAEVRFTVSAKLVSRLAQHRLSQVPSMFSIPSPAGVTAPPSLKGTALAPVPRDVPYYFSGKPQPASGDQWSTLMVEHSGPVLCIPVVKSPVVTESLKGGSAKGGGGCILSFISL
jgi:hypothetical protein